MLTRYPGRATSSPWIVAIFAFALIPGALFELASPDGAHIRWSAFGVGVGVGLLYWGVTAALIRRLRVGVAIRSLGPLLLLPYQVWTGITLVKYVNQGLDASPSMCHTGTVLSHERRTKGNDRITVTHWDSDEPPFTIEGRDDPGTVLTLPTHPGRLGFVWIETPTVTATRSP